jgi:nitrite reductase/ring-hydroxylating ferredoxin subunit
VAVVTFRVSGRHNCATVDGVPYMYARTELGSFVLPVRCPHRGGPLNLATLRPGETRLVCPWHERSTSVTKALRRGIPAVRRGDYVTTVLPAPDDAEYELGHRPVSPELAVA